MRVLITGISGFIGRRLALRLLEEGHEVYGIGFRRSIDDLREFWGDAYDRIKYEEIDILDAVALDDYVSGTAAPHFIYHLAAQANLPHAKRNPRSTLQINIAGSWNVIESAYNFGVSGIHLASSSDVYGSVPEEKQPITEKHPLNGRNPYALSKIAMEQIGEYFWQCDECLSGVSIIVTRLFTTTGAGQYTDAAVSYFAWQAAKIRLGLQEPVLKCGNTDNYRTFLDVDDVVEAFTKLPTIRRGEKFEDTVFNITGTEQSLRDIIEQLQDECGVEFEVASQAPRANDITRQLGDGCKFEAATDWLPKVPFTETVRKVYNYWLQKLG